MLAISGIAFWVIARILDGSKLLSKWEYSIILTSAIAILGSLAFSASGLGQAITGALSWVFGIIASIINFIPGLSVSGGAIMGLLALIWLFLLGRGLCDFSLDRRDIFAMAAVPLFAAGVGGEIGSFHATMSASASDISTSVMTSLIGG